MSNPARKPFLGEDIHYRSYGTPQGEYDAACRCAKITEVGEDPGRVSVVVFNPTGIFLQRNLKHDEERAGGTWHYQH